MERTINLKSIIYNSFIENQQIFVSILSLCLAYWLQDIVFPNTFSQFTTNVPDFLKNLNVSSVFKLIFPYLVAELLFFINNIIVSDAIPNIELNIVRSLTKDTLESLKTSKELFNVNEYIMNLKKVIESKALYYLIVSYIFPTMLVALGMIYYFMRADIKFGLFSCLVMFIFMYVTVTFEYETVNSSYENEDEINLFYDNIQDIISNYDTVITSGEINNELIKLDQKKDTVKYKYTDSEIVSTKSTFKLHMSSLITTIILNAMSFKLYIDKKIPKETLVMIAVTSILFMQYYNSTIVKFKNTSSYIGKFVEIDNYFNKFKIPNGPKKNDFIISNGDIRFENISLKYKNKQIIEKFDHNVKGGIITGIMGKVGTGKTSLLKMIAGLLKYDGSIYIDNQNISNCDYDQIMSNVAYIPQHPKMFNNTIYYNLTYGSNINENDLKSFLKKINFINFFNDFEQGLLTQVGKEGSKLSGGQKQIIALLRAILKNKKILLLDEPTSSLDPETKNNVINLITSLQNTTILIVSHDKDIYKLFDKIIKF